MVSDFAFPGSLLGLKFLLRVIVHQEFKKVEFYKTLLVLPIDIVYLAFTFSAAIMVNLQKKGHEIGDIKTFYSSIVGIFIATVLTIVFSREATRRFDQEPDKSMVHFLFFLGGLFVSLATLGISTLMIGNI